MGSAHVYQIMFQLKNSCSLPIGCDIFFLSRIARDLVEVLIPLSYIFLERFNAAAAPELIGLIDTEFHKVPALSLLLTTTHCMAYLPMLWLT